MEEVEIYCTLRWRETMKGWSATYCTVALTAGFSIPGGFNEEKRGPNLVRKAAFKAFMVMDTIAVVCSISALLLYFVTTMCSGIRIVRTLITASASLNIVSIIAMMLSFSTGTYVVLSPSSSLPISVCVLSSFCPLLFIIMFFPYICGVFFVLINKLSRPTITPYYFNTILWFPTTCLSFIPVNHIYRFYFFYFYIY